MQSDRQDCGKTTPSPTTQNLSEEDHYHNNSRPTLPNMHLTPCTTVPHTKTDITAVHARLAVCKHGWYTEKSGHTEKSPCRSAQHTAHNMFPCPAVKSTKPKLVHLFKLWRLNVMESHNIDASLEHTSETLTDTQLKTAKVEREKRTEN